MVPDRCCSQRVGLVALTSNLRVGSSKSLRARQYFAIRNKTANIGSLPGPCRLASAIAILPAAMISNSRCKRNVEPLS